MSQAESVESMLSKAMSNWKSVDVENYLEKKAISDQDSFVNALRAVFLGF